MIEVFQFPVHLKDYVALQSNLCAALVKKHPDVSNWEMLLDLPKFGSVVAGDDYWEFSKHGKGVIFKRCADGIEVDVSSRVKDAPSSFDYWRLLTYLDSLEVKRIGYQHENLSYDEVGVKVICDDLLNEGVLKSSPKASELLEFS